MPEELEVEPEMSGVFPVSESGEVKTLAPVLGGSDVDEPKAEEPEDADEPKAEEPEAEEP